MPIRRERRLISSLALAPLILTGCAPGYLVNGQRVTDQELAQYQAVWKPGTLEVTAKSAVAAKEHQGILNLIAALEARGATRDRPCQDLTLTDIVRATGTYLRFPTGEKFGPLSLCEDWRVLACGNKHSWIALVGPPPRLKLDVIYANSTSGDWLIRAPQP